jgi:hypothetical protein
MRFQEIGSSSRIEPLQQVASHRVYYKGGRWWQPPSPGCGESCVYVLLVAGPNTKCAPTMH